LDTKTDWTRVREREREKEREKFTFNKSFYGNGIYKMVLIIIATRKWFSLQKSLDLFSEINCKRKWKVTLYWKIIIIKMPNVCK
jgi:hypothetical protein